MINFKQITAIVTNIRYEENGSNHIFVLKSLSPEFKFKELKPEEL